jgi:hypothetical protein
MLASELVPQSEFLDDRAVAVDIRPLHVIEQAATLSDHPEEPTATVMILFVGAEVVGQIVDAIREERDLNASRPAVGVVRLVLRDRRGVIESHA